MNYHSKVSDQTFKKLRHGQMDIEARLNDPAHRKLRPGDLIIFVNRSTKEELIAKVVGLLKFETFTALFKNYAPSKFGADTRQELLDGMYALYSREDELKWGALGIKLHPLKNK